MSHDFIRRLKAVRFNSALVRAVLALFYAEGKLYRVPFGPIRGSRLRYQNDINFHMMLGLWELDGFALLRKVFDRYWSEDDGPLVIGDVGANVGFFTLWFARRVTSQGTVYAFEPAPVAAQRLRDHLVQNGITNTDVVEQACSDREGTIDFHLGFHHHASSLHAEWATRTEVAAQKITVPTTTLDHFFCTGERPVPHFIKMDIEGGGTLALQGCQRLAAEQRPLILIESHTPDEDQAISDLITQHDYRAFRVDDEQWVSKPTATYPDRQGVWGTLFLCPAEHRERFDACVR